MSRSPALVERFLVLDQERDDTEGRQIRLCKSLTEAVGDWDPSTRMSPVYIPRGSVPAGGSRWWRERTLVFYSMTHPVRLRQILRPDVPVWYSVGAFNVIAVCGSAESVVAAQAAAESVECDTEEWQVRDGRVTMRWRAAPLSETSWRALLQDLASARVVGPLRDAQMEFVPLLASALARSARTAPDLVPLLEEVGQFVLEEMRRATKAPRLVYEILGVLRTTNAGLSRFTSQAYSGISPIAQTECHYWVHSLLGTGLANYALWNVVRFVLRLFGEERIPEKIEALSNVRRFAAERSLLRRIDVNEFMRETVDQEIWHTDHLSQIKLPGPSSGRDGRAHSKSSLLPLIAHFSGRDGYMSSSTTLSAPLAAIAACNSKRWSLLTLTHELSHAVLRGVFSVLLPWGDDGVAGQAFTDAEALLRGRPHTALEALQRFLLVTLIIFDAAERGQDGADELNPDDYPAAELRRIVPRWDAEAQEVCAHVFDYLYFYNADPKRYVKAIWLSWSTLPDLSTRTESYVLRTLCAVFSSNMRLAGDAALEETKAIVARELADLPGDVPGFDEFRRASRYLEEKWDTIARGLMDRARLIKIVRAFFFSESVRGRLRHERFRPWDLQSDTEDQLGIGTRRVENPIEYIERVTTGHPPSASASLRMLTMLALNARQDV